MSFKVDPGVRYFSVGPTISALASEKGGKKVLVHRPDALNESVRKRNFSVAPATLSSDMQLSKVINYA